MTNSRIGFLTAICSLIMAGPVLGADALRVICENAFVNTEINNDLFEEGLSMIKDADGDDDGKETSLDLRLPDPKKENSVSVGQMTFSANDEKLTVKRTEKGNWKITVAPAEGSYKLQIEFFSHFGYETKQTPLENGYGVVTHIEKGKTSTYVAFDHCRTY